MSEIISSPTPVPPTYQPSPSFDRNISSSSSTSSTSTSTDSILQPTLNLDNHVLLDFPTLDFQPYDRKLKRNGANTLVFIHNALKKELAQLITKILPAVETTFKESDQSDVSPTSIELWVNFRSWWKGLLGFIFFVAEYDERIVNGLVDTTATVAKRSLDSKLVNELTRAKKSVVDRYEYSLEISLRAIDRALCQFEEMPSDDTLTVVIDKIKQIVNFVLETIAFSHETAIKCDTVCDVSVRSIENSLFSNLPGKSKSDRLLLLYMCVNWMEDETKQQKWLVKYSMFRSKHHLENAKKVYAEKRASLVENLV